MPLWIRHATQLRDPRVLTVCVFLGGSNGEDLDPSITFVFATVLLDEKAGFRRLSEQRHPFHTLL